MKADEPQVGQRDEDVKRNTNTLLFSMKGLEILHQVRRGQEKTMVMEQFNSILFHKSGPANKQHAYQQVLPIYK